MTRPQRPSTARVARACCAALMLVAASWPTTAQANETTSIVFRWTKVDGAIAYVIQVAKDRGFGNVVATRRVSKPVYRLTNVTERGYWWRVRAVDREGRLGPYSAGRYAQRKVAPPTLVGPGNKTKIGAGRSITLRWSASAELASYSVEVARDRGFKKVVARRSIPGSPKMTFTPKEPGTYWWRVGGKTHSGKTIRAGKARSFVVSLGAPKLRSPANGHKIRGTDGDTWVPLRFSGEGVDAFVIQVGRNARMSGATKLRATDTSKPFRAKRPGTYFWRVRGTSPPTGWSAVRSFIILEPASKSPLCAGAAGLASERVTLTHAGGAVGLEQPPDGWTLELQREGSSTRHTVSEGRWAPPLALEAGTYQWTLARRNKRGKSACKTSKGTFVVALPAVLPAPQLTAPEPGSTGLTWRPLPGAVRYEKDAANQRVRAIDRWERPGAWATAAASATAFASADKGASSDSVSHVHIGLAIGVGTNFGGILGARPTLEVGYWLPVLDRQLAVIVGVGWVRTTRDFTSSVHGLALSATVDAVPIDLSVAYRFDLEPVDVLVGGGLAIVPVAASVDGLGDAGSGETTTQFGGTLFVDVELPLGPGALFLDIRYSQTTAWQQQLVDVDPSGLGVSVSYRLEVP